MKIYSTLSNDIVITISKKADASKKVSKAVIEKSIIISGGANVVRPKTGGRVDPFVVTELTDADYKACQEHPVFKRMVSRGFVTTKEPTSPKADLSAQLTESQVKAKSPKAKISTGPVE